MFFLVVLTTLIIATRSMSNLWLFIDQSNVQELSSIDHHLTNVHFFSFPFPPSHDSKPIHPTIAGLIKSTEEKLDPLQTNYSKSTCILYLEETVLSIIDLRLHHFYLLVSCLFLSSCHFVFTWLSSDRCAFFDWLRYLYYLMTWRWFSASIVCFSFSLIRFCKKSI